MGADEGSGSGMQFERVEVAGPVAPPACARCAKPLDEYFELGGHMFCRPCVDSVKGTGAGPFLRALLFGGGAALLGTIAWYAIYKLTNSEFGLLGIVVGLFVGIAVRKGARGLGGWKYQALAMVLTYVSITTSYVPILIKAAADAAAVKDAEKKEAAPEAPGSAAAPKAEQDEQAQKAAPAAAAPIAQAPVSRPSAGEVLLALLFVFAVALATPFLAGASNFMGWIIIGIALYEAWKLNRRVPISGPFRFSGGLSVPAPAPVTPGMPPPAAAP
jgi:hypothetical protein